MEEIKSLGLFFDMNAFLLVEVGSPETRIKWRGKAIGTLAVLLFPIATFASKGLAPLFVVAALISVIDLFIRRRPPRWLSPFSAAMAVLIVVAAASVFWSFTPGYSLKTLISLLALMVGLQLLLQMFRTFDDGELHSLESGVILGGATGFALLLFELLTNGLATRGVHIMIGDSGFDENFLLVGLNPALSVASLFVWPWILSLHRRYSLWFAGLGIVVSLVILWIGEADTPFAALLAGIAVLVATWIKPKIAYGVLMVIVSVGIMAMPLIPKSLPDPLKTGKYLQFLPKSGVHRLAIWNTTVKHIADRPFFGHGFNTSRAFYGDDTKRRQTYLPDTPERKFSNEFSPIPLHPHNVFLQVWLEMGAVGAVALLALILVVIRGTYAKVVDNRFLAVGFGAITTALFIGSVSFGAWQNWWLGALFLNGALVYTLVHPGEVVDGVTEEGR